MVMRYSMRHLRPFPFIRLFGELEDPSSKTFVSGWRVDLDIVFVERTLGQPHREEVRSQLDIVAIRTEAGSYGEVVVLEFQRLQANDELVLRTVGKALVDVRRSVGREHAAGTSISPRKLTAAHWKNETR